jgi:hypothetical protein
MATQQRRRNPIFGGIVAAAMIGFGAWRLYAHFVVGENQETWRLVLSGAMILYGAFVGYQVLTQKND